MNPKLVSDRAPLAMFAPHKHKRTEKDLNKAKNWEQTDRRKKKNNNVKSNVSMTVDIFLKFFFTCITFHNAYYLIFKLTSSKSFN